MLRSLGTTLRVTACLDQFSTSPILLILDLAQIGSVPIALSWSSPPRMSASSATPEKMGPRWVPLHRCTVVPLHRCAAYLVSDSGAGELCEPKLEMAEIMARPAALLRALAWKEVDRRLRSIQRLEGAQKSR